MYWPINAKPGEAVYLYYYGDIWRFTLFWTLIVYGAVYLSASAYALAMQTQNWKSAWVIPLVFGVVGGLEAMLAGSVIGLMSVETINCLSDRMILRCFLCSSLG